MKRVAIVEIGYGTVGRAVIDQVIANREHWASALDMDVRIAAVAGRNGAVLQETDAELESAELQRVCRERGAATPADGASLSDLATAAFDADVLILMDAGAGDATADAHVAALEQGRGIVLSNKAPMSLPMSDSRSGVIWKHAAPGGLLRYEATCGAGLPVVSTLQTLLATADTVLETTGALSGTFGAIFSMVAEGMPFSEAVRVAKERGYTEPDPRDDLSGLDVARKALILNRTMGRMIDLDSIDVQSLVPDHLADVDIPTFLDELDVSDRDIRDLSKSASQERAALKYVATIDSNGEVAVGLRPIPRSTVLGALQGPENVVSFRTERYDEYPCVISGPGAGAAVTAAGMLGDALALAASMCQSSTKTQ